MLVGSMSSSGRHGCWWVESHPGSVATRPSVVLDPSNARGHKIARTIPTTPFLAVTRSLLTASQPQQVRIWDIRKQTTAYCLPAHSALVSDVR